MLGYKVEFFGPVYIVHETCSHVVGVGVFNIWWVNG